MRNSYSPDNCKVMIGGLEITSYSEVNTLPSIYIDGDVVRAYTKDGMLVTFKVKDVSKIPDKGYVTISYDGMIDRKSVV